MLAQIQISLNWTEPYRNSIRTSAYVCHAQCDKSFLHLQLPDEITHAQVMCLFTFSCTTFITTFMFNAKQLTNLELHIYFILHLNNNR